MKNRLDDLRDLAARLNREELDVLLLVADGLARGREVYGPLDLATDPRDFVVEASEEVRDALVYLGAALLRLRRLRRREVGG